MCPLCKNNKLETYAECREKSYGELRELTYYQCQECNLIFLDPKERLEKGEEKLRYGTHENNTIDQGYQEFLSKLWKVLRPCLEKKDIGLDYGCGPAVALAELIEADGFVCKTYDPFFADKKEVLEKSYNFLTCTEVIEHMFEPAKELEFWQEQLLKPRAYLGVMTKLVDSWSGDFCRWYYRKDPTHIAFYSRKTFEWIAAKYNWRIVSLDEQVQVFQKG